MVRPVDLQDNLSKAPIASNIQHVQQNSAAVAQRQTAEHLAQEHLLNQSRTRPAESRDAVELRLDQREESAPRRQQKKKAQDGEEAETDDPEAPAGAAHIDITA